MEIKARFTFDSVDHSKENELHAVISLKAPEVEWQKKRQPICVIPVVDVSTSMSGEKLDYARQSVLKLIDQLQPGDYCGLVAFGSNVHQVAKPREMTQAQKDELKAKVGKLHTEGCTNFAGGMRQGLEWLNEMDLPENVGLRVIMLTDGMANQGEAIGPDLLPLCEKLLGRGTLSAFGYGSDCDQDLLGDLARKGKGNYSFIRNPDDALSAFAKELGGLLSRYAQDIVIDVAPFNGHTIEEVVSDVDVEESEGKVKVSLPEILSEEERHIVLKVKTSVQSKALPRELNVLDVKVTYDVVGGGSKEHRSEEVKAKLKFVKPGEEQAEATKGVAGVVGIAMTVQTQVAAEEAAKAGNFDVARGLFEANAAFCAHLNLHDHAAGSRNIGAYYASSGEYNASGGLRRVTRSAMSRGSTMTTSGDAESAQVLSAFSDGMGAGSNQAISFANSAFTGAPSPVAVSSPDSVILAEGTEKPKAKAEEPKKAKGVSKARSKRW